MEPELSIVMPCLNEAETLAQCIKSARAGAEVACVSTYEVIVADNGSTDGSQAIAASEGARLVEVPTRGYGAALKGGIAEARGKFVLMGDSDASYDFSRIDGFISALRQGHQLVIGTRLRGKINAGAMPALHRYLGNPFLTGLANLLFHTHLSDYHCGLRAFNRLTIQALGLKTDGMEFASEMVIRAALSGLSIHEIPIEYYPDGRSRPPHLRTWNDGWRHLRFLLLYSPRWLFLYPGLASASVGLGLTILLLAGPIRIGSIALDVHTLLIAATLFNAGVTLVGMAVFLRTYASRIGLLPRHPRLDNLIDRFSLGLGLSAGAVITVSGVGLYVLGLVLWGRRGFGPLVNYESTLRVVIAGTTFLILGIQTFFGSFALSLLSLGRTSE